MCEVRNIYTSGWPTPETGVYVGRSRTPGNRHHFGNPFSHLPNVGQNVIRVRDRETAIANYRMWLEGKAFGDVEPERQQWILEQIREGHLKGRNLYCWCAPLACHGDVLVEMSEEAGS